MNSIFKLSFLCVLGFVFLNVVVIEVEGQIYAAQIDLAKLLNTNRRVVRAFKEYIQKERERLSIIKDRLQRMHEIRGDGSSEVLQNPLTAFLGLKALTVDLEEILRLVNSQYSHTEFKSSIDVIKKKFPFPTEEDLAGSVEAIKRVQETYHLPTNELIMGQIGSHCCTEKLTAEDCFELGHQNFIAENFDHSIMWLNQSWILLEDQSTQMVSPFMKSWKVFKIEVLKLLSTSYERVLSFKKALEVLKLVGTLTPADASSIQEKMTQLEDLIAKKGKNVHEPDFEYKDYRIAEKRSAKLGKSTDFYESLCRGESKHREPKLICRYSFGALGLQNDPYLRIGPFKEEILFEDPKIQLFHEILYDSEIEKFKKAAAPLLKRALVRDTDTGKLIPAVYRISKSAWIDDSLKIAKKVSTRIEHITGLTMKTAETHQVVNYGLGGQYDAHFDFIAKGSAPVSITFPETGNRIATFLAYMSDVSEGGATVFPLLNLSLSPVKGAAAFWYNLFPSGQGDRSTIHGACPVLRGSKWVLNKWIHEVGQEFRRPCGLQNMDPNDKRTD